MYMIFIHHEEFEGQDSYENTMLMDDDSYHYYFNSGDPLKDYNDALACARELTLGPICISSTVDNFLTEEDNCYDLSEDLRMVKIND